MSEEIGRKSTPLAASDKAITAPARAPLGLRGFSITLARFGIIFGFFLLWEVA